MPKRRKDVRAEEIISAALGVFQTKGFAATTMGDIARAAGVVAGTVYLYFPNKQELFKAAVRAAVQPNLDRMTAAAVQNAAPTVQLRAALSLWAEGMQSGRVCLSKLIIAEAGNFPELSEFYQEEVGGRVRQTLIRIIEAGIACGEFRQCDPAVVVRTLVAAVVMSHLWRHTFPNAVFSMGPADLVPALLDVVLNGIAIDRDSAP